MYVTQRFVLAEQTKDTIRSMSANFGYGQFSEFIFYKHYSRMMLNGKMESWADCVIRVTEGVMSIRKDHYIKNHLFWDDFQWQHYALGFAISMFNMYWLPPGRGLWAMGTEFVYQRGAMALYNCAFTNLTDVIGDDIHWAMDCLMNGVGVGAQPLRSGLEVFSPKSNGRDFVVEDSREGWCDSTKSLIESYLTKGCSRPRFIYDEIRPEGEPIKGFGGVASGPGPLIELHNRIDKYMRMYLEDPYYDTILLKSDIMNATGCCVVSGNVRRSAEILSGSIYDETFMNLKDYTTFPHRAEVGYMSNNSVKLEEPEDFQQLGEIARRVIKNGEPGFINSMNLPLGRIGKTEYARKDYATGMNPCLRASSKVLTPNGITTFDQVDVGSKIWSEDGWVTIEKKWSTGVNPVFAYRTNANVFYGTANHRVVCEGMKVEVKDAFGIDVLEGPAGIATDQLDPQDIMDGLVVGDGSQENNHVCLNIGANDHDYFLSEVAHLIGESYSKDYCHKVKTTIHRLPLTYERTIDGRFYLCNPSKMAGFLRGLYSANGSVIRGRVCLKASSFKVIEAAQMMLSALGIRSYYTKEEGKIIEFGNGTYLCRDSWNLQISTDRDVFYKYIGFIQNYKTEKLKKIVNGTGKNNKSKLTYEILSEEYLGEEETWDITVNGPSHTFWAQGCNVSNCGEIPLEHREVCNLAETLPTRCNNDAQWLKACEYATFYCSTVSLLPTHRKSTNKVVAKNRRIGVSLVDFTGWKHNSELNKVVALLRKGYEVVCDTNRWANGEAGVPEAIRKTTCKPGGTTPKLAGKTSGAGYPTFKWTVRRVRVATFQPIFKLLVKAGVPHEPDVTDPTRTYVFEFPIIQGPAKPAEEVTVWEQSNNIIVLQREWADNAVSNTLYFKPKWVLVKHLFTADTLQSAKKIAHDYGFDFDEIEHESENSFHKIKVTRNETRTPVDVKLYTYNIKHEEDDIENVLSSIAPLTKSVSLLPHTAAGVYQQMPEEGITEEEYNHRIKQIQPIDWSELTNSNPEAELYCDGPQCQINVG